MKHVFEAIATGEERLRRIPFVRRLEGKGNLDDAMIFGEGLTFFTMAFQDVLRLCEANMRAPELRRIVAQHCREERGHELWFLSDMAKLGTDHDLAWLFGQSHRVTRDATYELVADVCRASDDYVRLSLFLVLESTAEVFFSRVHEYVRTSGCTERLDYFSAHHHAIERGHHLLEENLRERFSSVDLTPQVRAEAIAVVGRGFSAFTAMFDEFEAKIVASKSRLVSTPRLRAVGGGESSH